MQPLGLSKTKHKVAGHGDWCLVCTSMLRRQLHRRRPREFELSQTGRAREKNRLRREGELAV